MKNLTVISHFFNEEYLLPWWLEHHKKIFDHGIMINYASTDNSVEIIKRICPTWEIVDSCNKEFAAFQIDQEVMQYEKNITGYKICLNTTEFLVETDIKNELDYNSTNCYSIYRATIVDTNPSDIPTYEHPLIQQKYNGFVGNNNINGDTRFIHNYETGHYGVGRHHTLHPVNKILPFLIFWYGFAPWTEHTIQRKLQIKNKIPLADQQAGLGYQHLWTRDDLEAIYQSMLETAEPILQ